MKQPKTIVTDRSANLKEAPGITWAGTVHRSCVWQIYQNAVKSLAHAFSISEEFTHDFSHKVQREVFIAHSIMQSMYCDR
jgi:hypothetical protein